MWTFLSLGAYAKLFTVGLNNIRSRVVSWEISVVNSTMIRCGRSVREIDPLETSGFILSKCDHVARNSFHLQVLKPCEGWL